MSSKFAVYFLSQTWLQNSEFWSWACDKLTIKSTSHRAVSLCCTYKIAFQVKRHDTQVNYNIFLQPKSVHSRPGALFPHFKKVAVSLQKLKEAAQVALQTLSKHVSRWEDSSKTVMKVIENMKSFDETVHASYKAASGALAEQWTAIRNVRVSFTVVHCPMFKMCPDRLSQNMVQIVILKELLSSCFKYKILRVAWQVSYT